MDARACRTDSRGRALCTVLVLPGSIIRDRPTGQMFAVYHDGFNGTERRTHKGRGSIPPMCPRVPPGTTGTAPEQARVARGAAARQPGTVSAPQPPWTAQRADDQECDGFQRGLGVCRHGQEPDAQLSWTGEPGPLTVHVEDNSPALCPRSATTNSGDFVLTVTETDKFGRENRHGNCCRSAATNNTARTTPCSLKRTTPLSGVMGTTRSCGARPLLRCARGRGPGWLVSLFARLAAFPWQGSARHRCRRHANHGPLGPFAPQPGRRSQDAAISPD